MAAAEILWARVCGRGTAEASEDTWDSIEICAAIETEGAM